MSALVWISRIGVLVAVFFAARWRGLRVIETAVTWLLSTIYPGVLPSGEQISGPKWQYPNGSIIQRFLNGEHNSEEWQKYGPVYRVWSGFHPEIVITTPEDLKHFSSDADEHPKTSNVNLGWFVGELLGRALGLRYGADWKRLRRIFDPAFTRAAAVMRIGSIDHAAKEFVNNLSCDATLAATGQSQQSELPRGLKVGVRKDNEGQQQSIGPESFELLSLRSAFAQFPYFLTATVIYGPMTPDEKRELWRLTEERVALNSFWIMGGVYRCETTAKLTDAAAVRRLRDFNTAWKDFNALMVKVRRETNPDTPIVMYWDQVAKGNMSMIELLQTLDELLMLNLDVITHVITWLVTLIADHAYVKQKLQEEAVANKEILHDYLIRTDTYLHRCLVESMRLRPFSIFTIGEASSEIKNFHGVLVKPNTQILVDVLAINVRNPFWGPRREEFDPSRFENLKYSDLRYNLHSFGIGSRKCMGQYVAAHIIKSLIVHLFDVYEVELSSSNTNREADVNSGWTPKSKASLRLTRRNGPVFG